MTIALAESGRWAEVIGAFSDLQDQHADLKVVLETAEYLAELAYRNQQPADAARYYNVMAEPANPLEIKARGLAGLGWLKMELNETSEAMATFDRLISECPESKFTCDAAMARAKHFESAGELDRASELYGMVMKNFPETRMADVARLRRAYQLQQSGDRTQLQEAKTLLSEYVQLGSDAEIVDEAIYQLAWVNQDLGLDEESRSNFQQLIDQYPNSKYWPDAMYRITQRRIQDNNIDAAKPLLAELLKQDNVPVEILSRVLYLQGEIASADQQWQTVSESMVDLLSRAADPGLKLKAKYWLAESYYRQDNFSAAIELFQELKTAYEQVDPTLAPWVWLRLAQCFGKQNDWVSAMEVAEAGKARFPGFEADFEFDFVRARGLEDAGRLNDCRIVYQLVVDSPRGNSTETAAIAQWRIGETFFHQENFRQAIESYYKVDSLFSYVKWRSAALIQAGKCQEKLNNWKHAMKLYQQLVDQFPESEHADVARKRLERVVLLAKVQTETESR